MEQDGRSENPKEPQSFDETLARIEAIVERLEGGNLPLEESLRLFEEGMTLVHKADGALREAELRIEKLVSGGDRETIDASELLDS